MRDIWFCPAISDSSAVSVVWSQSSDLRGILDSVQSVACENWQSFCRVSSPKTTLNGWCSSRVSMYCVSHVEQLKVWPERSSCHWRKSPKWTRPWYKSRPPWLVIAWTYGTPGENSGSHQQIASTWSHDISTFLVFSFTEWRKNGERAKVGTYWGGSVLKKHWLLIGPAFEEWGTPGFVSWFCLSLLSGPCTQNQ